MLIKPSWMKDEEDPRTDMQKLEETVKNIERHLIAVEDCLEQLRNVCFHTAQTTESFTERLRNFFDNVERKQ